VSVPPRLRPAGAPGHGRPVPARPGLPPPAGGTRCPVSSEGATAWSPSRCDPIVAARRTGGHRPLTRFGRGGRPMPSRPRPSRRGRSDGARSSTRWSSEPIAVGIRRAHTRRTDTRQTRREEALLTLDERRAARAQGTASRASKTCTRSRLIEPTRAAPAASSVKPRNPHTEESLSMRRLVVRPPFPGQTKRRPHAAHAAASYGQVSGM
jgi:hypothetical protein